EGARCQIAARRLDAGGAGRHQEVPRASSRRARVDCGDRRAPQRAGLYRARARRRRRPHVRNEVITQERVMQMIPPPLSALLMIAVALANVAGAARAQALRVYGPGGPEPAIREPARQFSGTHGIKIDVTAGPAGKWIDAAKADADLIYSGSETMMTDFI